MFSAQVTSPDHKVEYFTAAKETARTFCVTVSFVMYCRHNREHVKVLRSVTMCTVSTVVRVMCQYCSAVLGCDSKPHNQCFI
jgi:hypothetical protein